MTLLQNQRDLMSTGCFLLMVFHLITESKWPPQVNSLFFINGFHLITESKWPPHVNRLFCMSLCHVIFWTIVTAVTSCCSYNISIGTIWSLQHYTTHNIPSMDHSTSYNVHTYITQILVMGGLQSIRFFISSRWTFSDYTKTLWLRSYSADKRLFFFTYSGMTEWKMQK